MSSKIDPKTIQKNTSKKWRPKEARRFQAPSGQGSWRGSPPLRAGKPPPTPSGVAQSSPRPHLFDPSLPFPSLCTFLATFSSPQFLHHFWTRLFSKIMRFLTDFGTLLGSILRSFWHHFCITFSSIIFGIVFSFFSDFLDPSNRRNAVISRGKTMTFKKSQIHNKLKHHQFWHPFWNHFGSLLASFFDAFSA